MQILEEVVTVLCFCSRTDTAGEHCVQETSTGIVSTKGLPGALDEARSRWPGRETMLLLHAPDTGAAASPGAPTMATFFEPNSPEMDVVGPHAPGDRLGSFVLFIREPDASQSQDASGGS